MSQPIDLVAIYDKVLGEHSNDRGLLPVELQKSYSSLDKLVTSKLADQGLRRYTAAQYEAALREVVSELVTGGHAVSPRLPVTGSDLTDRAEELLVSNGTTAEAATLAQYVTALDDAKASLEEDEDQIKLRALAIRLERASGGKLRWMHGSSGGKLGIR
jgi:hypothetical protein